MKRKIAILLTIAMLLPCIAVPALASSPNEPLPQVDLDMSVLSAETQDTFNEQMELIATQLRAQNAMEQYDFYAETVYSELLALESGIMPLSDLVYNDPYGAYVSYTYPDSNGQPYIATALSYMSPLKTAKYIYNLSGSYLTKVTLKSLLVSIMGYIPKLEGIPAITANALLVAEAVLDIKTINQIKECGDYSVLQSSAFIGHSEFASVLRPWNNHETVTVPGHVTNIAHESYGPLSE